MKSLFTICAVMFFFIAYSIAGNIILKNTADYKIFITALSTIFLMQFVISKTKNKLLVLGIPLLIMVGIIYFFEGIHSFYNIAFVIFTTSVLYGYEDESVNYELYKARGIKTTVIITGLGAFLPFVNPDLSNHILNFYMLFLLSIILSLREARAYSFRLRKKKFMNLISLGSILSAVVFLDKISFVVFRVIKYVFQIIGILVDKIIMIILNTIGYFVDMSVRLMSKLYNTGEVHKVLEKYLDGDGQKVSYKPKLTEDVPLPPVISVALRVIVLILILIALYKMIMWYKDKTTKTTGDFEVEKERLEKRVPMKRGLLRNKLIKIFGASDTKVQIFDIYKKFEQKTSAMGLYKRHMTATQLGNLTKPEVDHMDAVDALTKIYNETKFSNHNIEEQKLKDMKDNFEAIKKQLRHH